MKRLVVTNFTKNNKTTILFISKIVKTIFLLLQISFFCTIDVVTLLLLAVSAPAMVLPDQVSYKTSFDW